MKFKPKEKVKINTLGPHHDVEVYVVGYAGKAPYMIGRHVVRMDDMYRVQFKDGTELTFSEDELVKV